MHCVLILNLLLRGYRTSNVLYASVRCKQKRLQLDNANNTNIVMLLVQYQENIGPPTKVCFLKISLK